MLTSQGSPKRTQQHSSCPTTLIFMLCTVLHPPILHVIPHTKGKRYQASQNRLPSHLQPRLPSHPTCGARVSRFTRWRLGALKPKDNSHKGCDGPPSWLLLPKTAFAALRGSWVMGCIRHCAILESNAGTVSWCLDFDALAVGRCTRKIFVIVNFFVYGRFV